MMKFKPIIAIFLIALAVSALYAFSKKETFFVYDGEKADGDKLVVFQFNIWQEGTMVPGGFGAIAKVILESKADIVLLSEVRNYKDVDFTNKLIGKLREMGVTYYSVRTDDSGILSKFKILEHHTVFPLKNDRGSIYKLVVDANGRRIAAYTAHLDYTHYASFLPRGYDGVNWKQLRAPVTDTSAIRKMNRASQRDEAITAFLTDARREIARGSLVFLGGDFNEPSHADWTSETAGLFDHRGVVFTWDVSRMLDSAGFIDVYRRKFPNLVSHPGFTYPSDNVNMPIDKLTWAPAADERERIDFIYYYPHENLSLSDVKVVGPSGSIVRGERVPERSQDPFWMPEGVWPSDHKGVLAVFDWNQENQR